MTWVSLSEAVRLTGLTRSQLEGQGRRGTGFPRRMDALTRRYVYDIPDHYAAAASATDVPQFGELDESELPQLPERYDARRDEYLLRNPDKPHTRPRWVPGWCVRAAQELDQHIITDLVSAFESAATEKAPPRPRISMKAAERPYSAVVPAADLHFGKYGSGLELGGEDFDRATCRQRLMSATEAIINSMVRLGAPAEWVVPVGNDWFNADNHLGTTTKGTPQDNATTSSTMYAEGFRLAMDYVETLLQVAPVRLVLSAGNHDRLTSTACFLGLTARYLERDDVQWVDDLSSRQYHPIGNGVYCFTHGDTVHPEKLAELMPTEARELWGMTAHAGAFVGHRHHLVSKEIRGVYIHQAPSLSGSDRYHFDHGHVGSNRRLACYIIDHADGYAGTLLAAGAA